MKYLFAAAVTAIFGSSIAWASPTVTNTKTLNVSGVFASGAKMDGTITINEETGIVTKADIKVYEAQQIDFDVVKLQQSRGYAYVLTLVPREGGWPILMIGERTSPLTLKGYVGGAIGPSTDIVSEDGTVDDVISAGTFGQGSSLTTY